MKLLNLSCLAIAFLIPAAHQIPSLAYAKAETITCAYKYVLGDNDTKHDARKIAFIEAKRRCAEQIGLLLTSQTIVSNSDLTKDEIHAYSLSFMKTEVISESFLPSGDGLAILVKLNAQYDAELMNVRIRELLSNRESSQDFKLAQEKILALEKQVISLQQQLGRNMSDEDIIRLRQERNAALSQYDAIISNLEALNTRTRNYARCGMTQNEIRSVLGQPRAVTHWAGNENWNYGVIWISFKNGVAVAIAENDPTPLDGRGCRSR